MSQEWTKRLLSLYDRHGNALTDGKGIKKIHDIGKKITGTKEIVLKLIVFSVIHVGTHTHTYTI